LESHYAPNAKVVLDKNPESGDGFIAFDSIPTPAGAIRLAAPSSVEGFARELYSALRFADAQGLTKVCVMQPEGNGLAAAIRDRLKRAAN
jgi:L-threonylcarbamoyladenylate synthase